jgi:hypothetical protein
MGCMPPQCMMRPSGAMLAWVVVVPVEQWLARVAVAGSPDLEWEVQWLKEVALVPFRMEQ